MPAQAQTVLRATLTPVTVCPASATDTLPPDFTAPACATQSFWAVDPQGTHLWIRAEVEVTEDWLTRSGPKGLIISGMAASEIYLNGVFLGRNGVPGDTARAESPGQMDAILHTPRDLLVVGSNTLELRVSSHHAPIRLRAPLHALGLSDYEPASTRFMSAYWPSLIMLGVFALGALVFAVMALRSHEREAPIVFALMCLILGTQLVIEASRALFPYPYPMHGWRLIGIVVSMYAACLCLIAHILHRFTTRPFNQRMTGVGLAALILLVPVLTAGGFDGKAGITLLTTLGLTALVTGYAIYKRQPRARLYLAGQAFTALSLLLTGPVFLDRLYYWIAAAFMLALFIQQALNLVEERRIRLAESERAQRLDAALVAAQQRTTPSQLELISAGRTQYVRSDEITQLKGAGDYVEICFEDGRTLLHTGTLTKLETALPDTFLRVHRSHIVNTVFVSALERDPGGAGRLILSTGAEAPVSRRILPKVKSALAEASA